MTVPPSAYIIACVEPGPAWIAIGGTLGVILAAGAIGCSGNSDAAVSQACADLAGELCNERSQCSAVAGSDTLGASLLATYGDLQTCLTRETLACVNGLEASGTGWSPTKVESCVSAFAGYSCQAFVDNDPPADCAPTGARGNGASCAFNAQCVTGFCQQDRNTPCGTCADAPVPGTATAYSCVSSTCGRDQRCIVNNDCDDVISINEACQGQCDRGLVCSGETATTFGTCVPAGTQLYEPCGAGCDGTLGLYCGSDVFSSDSCLQVTYVDATADGGTGAACGVLADGSQVGCIAGGCYTATGPVGSSDIDIGTCKGFAADHAACDSWLGPGCMPPARCVAATVGSTAGTCQVPSASMCH